MTNKSLVVSFTLMGVMLIITITCILLFYKGDTGVAIAALTGATVLVFGQLATLKITNDVKVTGEKTHEAVNSRVTELLKTVKELATAKGIESGRLAELERNPKKP